MDPRIEALKSTTFSGRRVTRQQIADIQETVSYLPNDSRAELGKTVCEHLNWRTAKGDYKVGACLKMLESLEAHGILKLPPKDGSKNHPAPAKPVWTSASDPQPEIAVPLRQLLPLRLETAGDRETRQLWNAFVDRYHYLGYRQPFGEHVRYFVVDADGRRLGCLLFESSTKALPCRDEWIGWSGQVRDRRRHLLVSNTRFVLFPWVRVKNLASCALGLAKRSLPGDWERAHGYRPVLCETFVDERLFRAVSCRAAGWLRIGETAGGRKKEPKGVYVMPLSPRCRETLRGETPAAGRKPLSTAQKGRSAASDRRFCGQWERIVEAAVAVAAQEDARWQKRRRVFDSLLIILFVFRLVLSRGHQGYRTTLCELWEQCQARDIPLPQEEPPAASTACEAREKLDEAAFKRLHREMLAQSTGRERLWKGHRIFAVDGTKVALPRKLADRGYRTAHENAHYPQGLVSVLYRLTTRIPVDFDLFPHEDERRAALTHLGSAAEGDVVVYDRGYYSFKMLLAHRERGLNCVFRLAANTNPDFDAFFASDDVDRTIDLRAPESAPRALRGRTCRVRLVEYVAADTTYRLATTLLDSRRYGIRALSDLYHGRWGIEELYKTGKFTIEQFHGTSERGVKQELYATLTLIALSRLFSNRCEEDIDRGEDDLPAMQANFKNGMRLVGREVEALFLGQAALVHGSVKLIMTGLSRVLQRLRPGRSFVRESKRLWSKWMKRRKD